MNEDHFKRAILHLYELGDSDILPPLFEFQFFNESSDAIIKKLLAFQFGSYNPVGAFEVLSPKTQTSFRIAHQLHPTDALLFMAAAIEIAPAVEKSRLAQEEGAFSYRFDDDAEASNLFTPSSSYHEWLCKIDQMCDGVRRYDDPPLVLETDISDFFGRIYFHRIEHVLDDIEAASSTRKVIENIIKNSRARQSYGLPVGGAASRIIAEGVLIDVDKMLHTEGYTFTRYVDDFRIFVKDATEAHTALCRLAEHLMLTEGLSLNAAKTKISEAESVKREINNSFSEIFTDSERDGLNLYLQTIYDGEDVVETIADDISIPNLISKLRQVIELKSIEYSSAKIILKALRVNAIEDILSFIDDFKDLLYFIPREFCMTIGAQAQLAPDASQYISDAIIKIINKSPFKDMTLVRIWVNHLFVTGALPISLKKISEITFGNSPIENRQNILIRARLQDRAFFRAAKTRFGDLSEWDKPAMMLGASCLASSEYDTWLSFCKGKSSNILFDEYIRWLKENRTSLIGKLDHSFVIKSRSERMTETFKIDSTWLAAMGLPAWPETE